MQRADKRRLWIGAWTLGLGGQKKGIEMECDYMSGMDACKKLIGIRQMGQFSCVAAALSIIIITITHLLTLLFPSSWHGLSYAKAKVADGG